MLMCPCMDPLKSSLHRRNYTLKHTKKIKHKIQNRNSHKIPASNELDDEEQPAGGLEAGVQPHQEGVVGGGLEHMLLRLHPVDVLVIRHQSLLDHLHRVHAFCALQFYHQHLEGDWECVEWGFMYFLFKKYNITLMLSK